VLSGVVTGGDVTFGEPPMEGSGKIVMSYAQAFTLNDETFGEKVHRAYRQGRAAHGFTYREIADRLSAVYPVSMQSLQRLELQPDIPRQQRVRLVAYLALIAYGFDPEDFGLNHDNTPLGLLDLEKTKVVLDPNNGCSFRSTADHKPEITYESPGQDGIGSRPNRRTRRKVA
jgi:hypothetical protein